MRKANGKETRTIVLGSIAAIAAATIVFGGISQTVKAVEVGKTEWVPTSYSVPYTEAVNDNAPEGYVKQEYDVKFVGEDQPTANDMKMEEAAELASQNWWRIFQVDLSGRTLEMTYNPIRTTQLRAIWSVNVKIDDQLSYEFALDAVTGENHSIAKRAYHHADIREGMDTSLIKNNKEYQELAKAAAETYKLVSGKVASVEYASQGFQQNRGGAKNADITFRVKSDQGEGAQISFSRYNQELLTVEYSSWLEEAERLERRIEQELKAQASVEILADHLFRKMEDNGIPVLRETKK